MTTKPNAVDRTVVEALEQGKQLCHRLDRNVAFNRCISQFDIAISTALRQAKAEAELVRYKEALERLEPIGWIQERHSVGPQFFFGDLNPKEVHDNGLPCYRVFLIKDCPTIIRDLRGDK